jgi:cation transport regulator ChaC
MYVLAHRLYCSFVAQIAGSRGPSGHNAEYLLRLAHGLPHASADEHVSELAHLVRTLAVEDAARFPELADIVARADADSL